MNLNRLQAVQNSAARLVTKTNRFDNVSTTNLIKNLHWLRIKDRISFKILLIVQKALIETAPLSIQSLLTKTEGSPKDMLKHSPSNGKYGDRSFVVAAPKLWNALPPDIRNEQNKTRTISSRSEKLTSLIMANCLIVKLI